MRPGMYQKLGYPLSQVILAQVPSKVNQNSLSKTHDDSETIRAETDIKTDNESLAERNRPFVFSFVSQASDVDVAPKTKEYVPNEELSPKKCSM
jgi:hypothetical protein